MSWSLAGIEQKEGNLHLRRFINQSFILLFSKNAQQKTASTSLALKLGSHSK